MPIPRGLSRNDPRLRYALAKRRRLMLEESGGSSIVVPDVDAYTATGVEYNDGGTGGAGDISTIDDALGSEIYGFDFNDDGTVVFVCSWGNSNTHASFTLSTPYDLSTATQSGSTETQFINFTGMRMADDGTHYGYFNAGSDKADAHALTTPFVIVGTDVLTSSILDTEIGSNDSTDYAMGMSGDGLYVAGLVEISNVKHLGMAIMNTAWDFDDVASFATVNVATEMAAVGGGATFQQNCYVVNGGGTVLFFNNGTLYKIDLTTPGDPSGGVTVTSQAYDNNLCAFSRDLTRMWTINRTNSAIKEYSTAA